MTARAPKDAGASSTAPAVPVVTDSDGWETVHTESAAVVIFTDIGDTFVGVFDGEEHIHPDSAADDSEDFDRYKFTGEDGQPYAINQSYTLREAMGKVKIGELTRITYIKDVQTKRALNPLKDFRVDVKRG